jgi:LmbE family N-acetylglucosaminyl deacetylase
MSQAVTIILSPHYDDAVFGLGGMLTQRKGRGEESFVVTLFGGQAPAALALTWWNKETGFASNVEAEEFRVRENRNALNMVGVDDDHILDSLLDDVQYRNEEDAESEAATAKAVKEEIASILSRFHGRRVSVYGSMSTAWGKFWEDSHPDHAVVHDAYLEIFRGGEFPAVDFYLYEDVVPYVYRFTHDRAKAWVEENDRIRLEETVVQLSEHDFSSKLAGLKQYGSQMKQFREPVDDTLISYSSRLCSSLDLSCYACEVVYRIFPAKI